VRLGVERASDRVDDFGRLLRYVIRLDSVNVNLRLVALGAAAPCFYEGVRGAYANRSGSRNGRGRSGSAYGGRVLGRATTRTAGSKLGARNERRDPRGHREQDELERGRAAT
jgi:endonuclease YncB( thermonuclease family)